jgi:hypothetical protein
MITSTDPNHFNEAYPVPHAGTRKHLDDVVVEEDATDGILHERHLLLVLRLLSTVGHLDHLHALCYVPYVTSLGEKRQGKKRKSNESDDPIRKRLSPVDKDQASG